jgi:NADPH:quinone reductase-like Zn-dependent oxidoreductase
LIPPKPDQSEEAMLFKAYAFTEYGGPDTQTYLELPVPAPGPGQLLVAVHAAGMNPADWKIRAGYFRAYLDLPVPLVFGNEVAGVVEQVGPGVDRFVVGDEVFGQLPLAGGYAEYAVLSAEEAAAKPANVSFASAATLALAGGTAYSGLNQLGLTGGETLLIIGAGGGVGVAATQLARSRASA